MLVVMVVIAVMIIKAALGLMPPVFIPLQVERQFVQWLQKVIDDKVAVPFPLWIDLAWLQKLDVTSLHVSWLPTTTEPTVGSLFLPCLPGVMTFLLAMCAIRPSWKRWWGQLSYGSRAVGCGRILPLVWSLGCVPYALIWLPGTRTVT